MKSSYILFSNGKESISGTYFLRLLNITCKRKNRIYQLIASNGI